MNAVAYKREYIQLSGRGGGAGGGAGGARGGERDTQRYIYICL